MLLHAGSLKGFFFCACLIQTRGVLVNYYERHIGDYLKDTAHLSLLEHGIYTRLLDIYYTKESGINEADAARLVGARSKDEKVALASVLNEFFCLSDGIYTQARADMEIERLNDKRSKASASASARWSHVKRSANAMRTHSERTTDAVRTQCDGNARAPVPNHQAPIKDNTPQTPQGGAKRKPSIQSEHFSEFWESWPPNERKHDKAKCLQHWAKSGLDAIAETIINDVRSKRGSDKWMRDGGQFIEAPLTYLRGKRWEDGIALAVNGKAWYDTGPGIEAKGVELGVGPWDRQAFESSGGIHGEPWGAYAKRVFDKAGHTP